MSVSLRDFFAAHAAAALVGKGISPVEAAKQAYDVADALVEERRFRDDAAWLSSPPDEGETESGEESDMTPEYAAADAHFDRPHLLEDPIPPLDDEEEQGDIFDPGWDDRAMNPAWDREPRWTGGEGARATPERAPISPRPGLVRTVPEQAELPMPLDPPAAKRMRSA